MNLFLILGIIFANIVAVTIVYQILKRLPKKEILIFIAANVTIIYLLVSFVYFLSGIGIDSAIHENAKNFVVYLFVPVNVILFVPYIAIQYKKLRQNKMDMNKLLSKIATIITILIIVSVGEFFYFKNIQKNIKSIGNGTKTNTVENYEVKENENTNMNTNTNNMETNTTNQNTINNQIVNNMTNQTNNTIVNEISNQIVNNKTNTIN